MDKMNEMRNAYKKLSNPTPYKKEETGNSIALQNLIQLKEISLSMFYIDERIADLKEARETLKQQAKEISNG